MSRKAKIQLSDGSSKVVVIELDATEGATIGKNLRGPDGKVLTVAQLRALLASSVIFGTRDGEDSGPIGSDEPPVVPSPLTAVDDTNVTMALGGYPEGALLNPASITLGWTGTLSKARGGFGENASGLLPSIAELNYVDGVTSAIQTQLDGKQPLDSDLTAIAALTTTSYGRAFLALVDAAAARTYIGAGTSSFSGVFADLTSKPTTLSGYGITDAQPLDSDLTAIAALATNSFGRGLLPLADAAAVRSYIGAGASGFSGAFADLTGIPTTLTGYGITDAQPLDSDLTAIAALATTSFGRGLLPLADAAAVRSYIGAGASGFSGAFADLTGIPTTLSGYGIVDAQPLDSDLTAIAALTTTSYGRAFLALADAAAARTYIGAFSGAFTDLTGKPTTLSGYGITDAQPLDSDLTAIAALTTTSYGRGLLALADAAATRSYIGAIIGTDVQAYSAKLAAYAGGDTPSAFTLGIVDSADAAAWRTAIGASAFSGVFADLTSKPTTLSGYGITDAQPLDADLTTIAALTTASFGRNFLTLINSAAARAHIETVIGANVQAFSAKLDAYASGDTPSAFTLGIVDSADASAWRSAIGASGWGTSSLPPGSAFYVTTTIAGQVFKLMWGSVLIAANDTTTVTLPTAFTAHYAAVISQATNTSTGAQDNFPEVLARNLSNFTVFNAADQSATAGWIAIGV